MIGRKPNRFKPTSHVPSAVLALEFMICVHVSAAGLIEGEPIPTPHCDAAAVQALVGLQYTPEVYELAQAKSGAKFVRNPESVATMDRRVDRLDIRTDRNGRIIEITCS